MISINHVNKLVSEYEDIKGWQEEIDHVKEIDDLPTAARDYVKRIEDLTGTPPYLLSVGPGREQTMLLKNPFDK